MLVRKWIGALAVTAVLSFGVVNSVGAYCDSASCNIPKLPGHKIQSDCWFSHVLFPWKEQKFVVSAKLVGNHSPTWIKTKWSFQASGIGVSVGGASGSLGGNSFSGEWTNEKGQKISCHTGTFKLSGIPLTGSLTNTATVFIKSVTRSATASCSRAY